MPVGGARVAARTLILLVVVALLAVALPASEGSLPRSAWPGLTLGAADAATTAEPIGRVRNFAGTQYAGYSGDGGPATSAQFYSRAGDVEVAADGAVYVSDRHNDRIRRIGVDGIVTTIAGTGTAGFSGDGGPATAAMLDDPSSMAFDGAGNLYVVVWQRIRKIAPDGTITTIAGNPDAACCVWYKDPSGRAATDTKLSPSHVAIGHDGLLYFSDHNHHAIFRIGGDGLLQMLYWPYKVDGKIPYAVAFPPDGALRYADSSNRVLRLPAAGSPVAVAGNGTSGTIIDGAVATDTPMNRPSDIAFDDSGNMFLSYAWDIARVDRDGRIRMAVCKCFGHDTAADDTPALKTMVDLGAGLAVNANGDLLYVQQQRVRRVTAIGSGMPLPGLPRDQAVGMDAVGTGSMGDPVNTATGDLTDAVLDVAVPDLPRAIEFGRTYNSSDARVGVLGRGWRASFEFTATTAVDGTVTVAHPSGRQVTYPTAPGGYATPPGAAEELLIDGGRLVLRAASTDVRFDDVCRAVEVTDRATGRAIVYTRDADGNVVRIAAATRHVDLTYAGGRLARATVRYQPGQPEHDGTIDYSYDVSGNLTSVRGIDGQTVTYGYDQDGRLISATDAAGIRTHLTSYDSSGHVSTQTDARGGISTFTYDVDANWTGTVAMLDPAGGRWVDVYDNRVLVQRTDPAGVTTYYRYDDRLNLTSYELPSGVTSFVYDSAGRIVQTVTPLGTHATAYDAAGRVASETGADGRTTTYGYDQHGHLTTETTSDGGVTSYTYTADHLPATITDPEGRTTSFGYDAHGLVTSVTDPAGLTTQTVRDPWGHPSVTTRPDGGQVTTSHTIDGRLLETIDPTGRSFETRYDTYGRLHQHVDAAGRTTTYSYDTAGQVETITDSTGRTATFRYDVAGRISEKTDPKNRTATFGYDGAGRLKSVSDVQGTVATSFNRFGKPASITRIDGSVLNYTYDMNGQLTRITGPGSYDEQFTYDAQGKLATHKRSGATAFYRYDSTTGRLTSVRLLSSVSPYIDATTTYSHNKAGDITSVKRPDGTVDVLGYDQAGRLVTITRGTQRLLTRGYDSNGRLASRSFADGSFEALEYDLLGRPVSRQLRASSATDAAILDHEQLTYHAATGKIVRIDHRSGPTAYAYDDRDHLARVCPGRTVCDGTETSYQAFTYDILGNRLTATTADADTTITDTYSYNSVDQLVEVTRPGAPTRTWSYDAAGRVTRFGPGSGQPGDVTLTWHAAVDLLTSASQDDRSWAYSYTPDSMRLRTTETTAGVSVTRTFVHDPLMGGLFTRTTGSTVDKHLPMSLGRHDGATFALNHHDHLGSLRTVTAPDGSSARLVADATYDPWGALAPGSTRDPANDTGFGGHADGPAGLVMMGARPYDADTGRFLSLDPAGGLYVYANNDPLWLTDPSGQVPCLRGWDSFRSCVAQIQPVAEWTATIAGGITVATALTGVGAPIAAVTGPISAGAGAIAAAGRGFMVVDTCVNGHGKGSCGAAVAFAALDIALRRVKLPTGKIDLPAGPIRPSIAPRAADEFVDLASPARRRHILDGEVRPNGTFGGGHRAGTGFPGKTEFPASWSDDQIMHHISDIATDPSLTWRAGDRAGDFFVTGTRNGVETEVLIRRGEIWTAYPTR